MRVPKLKRNSQQLTVYFLKYELHNKIEVKNLLKKELFIIHKIVFQI
jgi:hypothetical protein